MPDEGDRNGIRFEPLFVEEEREASVLRFANSLLRHRVVVVGSSIVVAVLVVGMTLLQSRSYTSTVSFTPAQTNESQLSQVTGLASRFGVQIAGGGGNRSPQFYAHLLRSDVVLQKAVGSHYSLAGGPLVDSGSTEGSLTEVFGIVEEDSLLARAKAMERLRNMVEVRSDVETGVVRLSVRSPRPGFSRQVGDRLLNAVNEFNLERRSSQAAEERHFLEERVQVVRSDLAAAEDSLRHFLDENRRFEGAPGLRFEHDRLQRRVDRQQQVYTSLLQSLEQAKIEEVRTTPLLTVVQPPMQPALPDRRHLLLKAAVGLIMGGLLGIVLAIVQDARHLVANDDSEYAAEFRHLIGDVSQDFGKIVTRVRQALKR